MKTEKVNEFIKKNYRIMSDGEIGKQLNLARETIFKHRKALGLEKITGKATIDEFHNETLEEVRERKSSQKEKASEKKHTNQLLEENERLRKELEASLGIKAGINPRSFHYKVSSSDSEATAVVLMSDFHVEEWVDPKTINNLNEYTLAIAEKRVTQLFQNTLKLVKTQQHSVKIDTLVVALLGDIISSSIHDALLEINQLRPIEAIIFAENLVIGGIQYLLDNSKLNLVIPCHVGNHPRMTKKVHIATEQGNNLETFMYHHMANHFRGNKRVKFLIADGYLSYLQIYDFTVCFQHGHAIRYAGGIGGLTIPVNKAIAQWEKLKRADLYCFGHWHQMFDGGNFICNGSLIGWNSFATFIKAGFEKPKQAFFLIDKKRGCKSIVAPVMFDI